MPGHFSDIQLFMRDGIESPSLSWLISNILTPTDAFSLKLTFSTRPDKQAEKTAETWGCLARNKVDELCADCSHSCHGYADHQSVFGRNAILIFLLREVVHIVTPKLNTDYSIIICMDFVKQVEPEYTYLYKHPYTYCYFNYLRSSYMISGSNLNFISLYIFIFWQI